MSAGSVQELVSCDRRPRMRAVIADAEASRRDLLRRTLLSDGTYHVVGEALDAEQCAVIIANESPELVICQGAYAPPPQQADCPFPLLITVSSGASVRSEKLVCDLAVPLRDGDVRQALAMAASRIVQLKVNELSALLEAYLRHGQEPGARVDRIDVEDEAGRSVSLRAEDVLWIKSAGNYVQFYTAAGVFMLRATISNLADRLAGSGFTRIHRCVVVNDRAVQQRRSSDGKTTSVVLIDGTELLVGPNFRGQVAANAEQ